MNEVDPCKPQMNSLDGWWFLMLQLVVIPIVR